MAWAQDISSHPPVHIQPITFQSCSAEAHQSWALLARPHPKLVVFAVMGQSPSRTIPTCINSPGLPKATELHSSGHREFILTALTVCHHWRQEHGPKRSYCLGVQQDNLLISDVSVLRKPLREQKMLPSPYTQPNPPTVTKLSHQVPGFGTVPLQLQESNVFSKVTLTDTELMPIKPKAVLSTSARLHQYTVSHQPKHIPSVKVRANGTRLHHSLCSGFPAIT